MFEEHVQPLVDFVRLHQAWAAPIVFVLSFAESLAFISLLVPAWGALVLIGTVVQAGGLDFWSIWIAASVGAALGDWLSYWIGLKLEHAVQKIWPLSRHPQLIPKGEAFIRKWGALGIFIGRFSGPLRASVPLVAGILRDAVLAVSDRELHLRLRLGRDADPARRRDLAGAAGDLEVGPAPRAPEFRPGPGCSLSMRPSNRFTGASGRASFSPGRGFPTTCWWMLVAEKMMAQGFHYPFPSLAYVEKNGDGYREVMVPWNPTI